jgi:hypothetical protein
MSVIYQRNRAYSLVVGDGTTGDGFEVTNLQCSFDVSKSSSAKDKTNSANIEITNLSEEKRKFLEEDFIGAVFSAGYHDTTVKRLFSGQVTKATSRKSGTDIITQIQMGAEYTDLNHKTLSKFVAPGKTYKDVIEELRKELPGVSRAVYNGLNINNPILDGYPLSGTARQMLDEISESQQIEYHIDDGILYANDMSGTSTDNFNTAFVISKDTGLIELPYAITGDTRRGKADPVKKGGIQMKILLNPEIVCGSIIKLEDDVFAGYYKVNATRTYGQWRGNDWYTDLRCEEKIKV